MSSRDHALLSASGSTRWINCPPSARLEEKFTENQEEKTSFYAEEGTLAHEFGELELRLLAKGISKEEYTKRIKKLRKSEYYSTEMEGEVDKYVTYVMEELSEAGSLFGDPTLLIEEKLDYSHVVEEGFGTGDACIISDGVLHVIDLKYGKGVQVYAKENSQLKLYGLGALEAYALMYDIHTVRLSVSQPRLDHEDTWDVSVEDLTAWADEIRKIADVAFKGEGDMKAGDWCRWCDVNARCKTLAEQSQKDARSEFADESPALLSDSALIDIYKNVPTIQIWIDAVQKYMLTEAENGKKWEGYKLVEGRSNRKIKDPEAVIKTLRKEKYKKKEYINEKLAGIGQLEKLLGKQGFADLIGEYVIKPQGKPTLVEASDKRPAMGIEQAKEDFS